MAEVGQVIEVKDTYVVVKLERSDACGKCQACTMGENSKEMILEAKNICKAKVGDLVSISLEQSNFLKAVGIMYGIPLIALLLGIGIGYVVSKSDMISLICGLLALAVCYFSIHRISKHMNMDQYRPTADSVVKQTDEKTD